MCAPRHCWRAHSPLPLHFFNRQVLYLLFISSHRFASAPIKREGGVFIFILVFILFIPTYLSKLLSYLPHMCTVPSKVHACISKICTIIHNCPHTSHSPPLTQIRPLLSPTTATPPPAYTSNETKSLFYLIK